MSEIPQGWIEAPIGDLCTLKNGRAFKPTEWSTKGLPIVRIQNLNKPSATYNYYEGEFDERYYLKGGELLFAWSGTPGTSFGAHVWKGGEAVLNQHIFRVDFDANKINGKFFRYAINQKLEELIGVAHGGVGLRHVTKGKFEGTNISLPPLPEQKRIADKLDTLLARVDATRERLDRIPATLKQFRQAVLAAATSGALTEGWREVNSIMQGQFTFLGTMGEILAGQSPSVSEVNREGRGVAYVTGPEQWDGKKILAHKWTEHPKRMAPNGSIFVTVKGAGVGKTFPGCEAAIGRDVYAFVPNKEHDHHFVLFAIQASAQDVVLKAKGLIPGLTKADIADHEVYVPLRIEQKEIVRRVEKLFAFADNIEARYQTARAQVDKLTPALLAKAFRGELVEQDPNDEPAEKLLERVRAAKVEKPARKDEKVTKARKVKVKG